MGYTENAIFNAGITMDGFGDADAGAFKKYESRRVFC